MDYWEYLAHGQKGTERDNHRYYARELVGNRGGKNVYRYFYSAEEYASYRRSKGSHAGAATKAWNGHQAECKEMCIKSIPWSCSLEGSGGRLFFMA